MPMALAKATTPCDSLQAHVTQYAYAPQNPPLLQFMDRGGFDEALESLDSLITDYAELEQAHEPKCLGDSHAKLAF